MEVRAQEVAAGSGSGGNATRVGAAPSFTHLVQGRGAISATAFAELLVLVSNRLLDSAVHGRAKDAGADGSRQIVFDASTIVDVALAMDQDCNFSAVERETASRAGLIAQSVIDTMGQSSDFEAGAGGMGEGGGGGGGGGGGRSK